MGKFDFQGTSKCFLGLIHSMSILSSSQFYISYICVVKLYEDINNERFLNDLRL